MYFHGRVIWALVMVGELLSQYVYLLCCPIPAHLWGFKIHFIIESSLVSRKLLHYVRSIASIGGYNNYLYNESSFECNIAHEWGFLINYITLDSC